MYNKRFKGIIISSFLFCFFYNHVVLCVAEDAMLWAKQCLDCPGHSGLQEQVGGNMAEGVWKYRRRVHNKADLCALEVCRPEFRKFFVWEDNATTRAHVEVFFFCFSVFSFFQ